MRVMAAGHGGRAAKTPKLRQPVIHDSALPTDIDAETGRYLDTCVALPRGHLGGEQSRARDQHIGADRGWRKLGKIDASSSS